MNTQVILACLTLVLLSFLIEPHVRYIPIEDQKFTPPIEVPSTSIFKIQINEDKLLHPSQWSYLSTGLALDIPKGYHGHLYAVHSLTRDGIILIPSCIPSGENRTISPLVINSRMNDYMIGCNRTIAFIVFVKHLAQNTLEELKV